MRHTTPAVGSDATPSQPHRRQGWLDWTGPLSRAGVAVVWIWAGPAKLADPNGCGAVGARLPAAARGPGPPGALGLALSRARPSRAAADRDRQPDRRRRLGRLAGGVHAPDRLGLGSC